MSTITQHISHRPYPVLSAPWVMHMRWHDLLFAHWPVEVSALRELIPRELEIDTYDGRAWIGIVPFRMDNVRLRGLPPLPMTGAFPEINVRTYVTDGQRAGVWFLSLDAPSWLANAIARFWFKLNYRDARISCDHEDEWVTFHSNRHDGQAEFRARYRPVGTPFHAGRATLERWLTDRYCLYAGRGGQVYRGEIHHEPWLLQRAEAELHGNTMSSALGISLPGHDPHILFARRTETRVWWPRRLHRDPTCGNIPEAAASK
jgi:uncharacterized protein